MKLIAKVAIAGVLASTSMWAQDNPFTGDVKNFYNQIKNTLLKAADKMPEANYSFRTVEGVRTFGELVGHAADVQNMLCGMAKGEKKMGTSQGKTSKADLKKELENSIAYCDAVFNSTNDKDGMTKVNMFGQQVSKLGVLSFVVAHDNETYGTMVAYLRIKGVVPPSSEGRP